MIHHNDADTSIITRDIVASWHLLSFCCTIYNVSLLLGLINKQLTGIIAWHFILISCVARSISSIN